MCEHLAARPHGVLKNINFYLNCTNVTSESPGTVLGRNKSGYKYFCTSPKN